MSDQELSLYRRTLADRQLRYDEAIASGFFTPFIYPWDSLPALWLFLAMLLTPKLPKAVARGIRYLTFVVNVCQCTEVMVRCRTLGFAGGYDIGLMCAWGLIMSTVFLLFNDIGTDYERLEWRPLTKPEDGTRSAQESAIATSTAGVPNGGNVKRRQVFGVIAADLGASGNSDKQSIAATRPYKLVWQRYPDDLRHALDWTLDLVTAFRGVNWNFRNPTASPIDAPLPQAQISTTSKTRDPSKATAIPRSTLKSLQSRSLRDFVLLYIMLDLLKTTMVTDPYFLGTAPLSSPTPWIWLANLNSHVPIATRLGRLVISLVGVMSGLTYIFSLSAPFFTLVLPAVVDPTKITNAPILEPALYPPYWGNISSTVTQSGLAGFWGKFWHQSFRYGVSDPSRYFIQTYPSIFAPRSSAARILQISIAFLLTGFIHFSASYTTFQPSRPRDPYLFFLSQGLGILVQTYASNLLVKRLHPPIWLRKSTNVLSVLIYLYFTGPLLADDFARCGIWLFEPVPVSVFRGLLGWGPGGRGEGWWCWSQEGSKLAGWWKDERWWRTGVAFY